MKLNKKGFTLVELLAVIVILAVVMLIAVTAVGPAIERSNKGALARTGQSIIEGAKSMYDMDPLVATKKFATAGTYCVQESALTKAGEEYVDLKGQESSMEFSVLVTKAADNSVTFKVYVSNGSYYIDGQEVGGLNIDNVKAGAAPDTAKIGECGGSGTKIS